MRFKLTAPPSPRAREEQRKTHPIRHCSKLSTQVLSKLFPQILPNSPFAPLPTLNFALRRASKWIQPDNICKTWGAESCLFVCSSCTQEVASSNPSQRSRNLLRLSLSVTYSKLLFRFSSARKKINFLHVLLVIINEDSFLSLPQSEMLGRRESGREDFNSVFEAQ